MTVKIKDKDLYDKYLQGLEDANTNSSEKIYFAYCFLKYATKMQPVGETKAIVDAIFNGEEVELEEQKYEVRIAPEIPVVSNMMMYTYLVKDKNGTIFQDCKTFDYGYDGQLTWSEIPEEYRKWAQKVED